jgi:hypothetical protein
MAGGGTRLGVLRLSSSKSLSKGGWIGIERVVS